MSTHLTCDHCAQRIGVYETVVMVSDNDVRRTSLAAEPDLAAQGGRPYHLACHLERSAATAA